MKRNNLNFKNSNESSLQHKKSISPKYSINTTPKNIKHKT